MCEDTVMKLFHQLLVAPAALGLLAPIAANASEFNLSDIAAYSDIEQEEEEFFDHNSFKASIPSSEVKINNSSFVPEYEAGSFSDTTVASQTASFLLSGGEGNELYGDLEAVQFTYYYGMSLDTSFNGGGDLNVGIETGNTDSSGFTTTSTLMDFGSSNGDILQVVDLNYTNSFGDLAFTVGDSLDASSQFAGACTYSGFTDHLSDCGTGLSAGIGGDVSVSTSYDFGNGFVAGFGATGAEGSTSDGIFTEESVDGYAAQVAYAGDSFGAALSYSNLDSDDATGTLIGVTQDTTVWGLNGYYTIDKYYLDAINLGYETADPETGEDTINWFAGLTSAEIGPGTINLGIGSSTHLLHDAEETLIQEISYGWDVSDSQSMTVGVFAQEQSGGMNDYHGVALSTTFSF